MKSPAIQTLLKKGCSGTILTAIPKSELCASPIPILPAELQARMADLIQRSFALKSDSTRLLETAKLQLEREIERGL